MIRNFSLLERGRKKKGLLSEPRSNPLNPDLQSTNRYLPSGVTERDFLLFRNAEDVAKNALEKANRVHRVNGKKPSVNDEDSEFLQLNGENGYGVPNQVRYPEFLTLLRVSMDNFKMFYICLDCRSPFVIINALLFRTISVVHSFRRIRHLNLVQFPLPSGIC